MTNIPPFSQLDPRVQRTMTLFYETFTELLKDRHYKFIKVQDITQAANLNRATFYNHFDDKKDFIIYCSREGFRRYFLSRIDGSPLVYSLESLKRLLNYVFEFMFTEYAIWHYQWDEILFEKALRTELFYILSDWLNTASEISTQDMPSRHYALILSSAIIGYGLEWCENGCVLPVQDLSHLFLELFSHGLPGISSS